MLMSEPGERIKWRAHFNQLIARPIPRSAFPELVKRMIEDGLICLLEIEGYQWYCGRYRVSAKAVRDIWGLSKSQWKRLMGYIYECDPFSVFVGEGDETQVSNHGSEESGGELEPE